METTLLPGSSPKRASSPATTSPPHLQMLQYHRNKGGIPKASTKVTCIYPLMLAPVGQFCSTAERVCVIAQKKIGNIGLSSLPRRDRIRSVYLFHPGKHAQPPMHIPCCQRRSRESTRKDKGPAPPPKSRAQRATAHGKATPTACIVRPCRRTLIRSRLYAPSTDR